MNKKILTVITFGVALSFVGCKTKKVASDLSNINKMTQIDSAAYAFGVLNGKSFANYINSVDSNFNKDKIIEGFAKSIKGISKDDYSKQESFFKKWAEERDSKKAEELKTSAQKYLDENKKKEGVKETKSGLQYQVLQDAIGEKPTVQDTVIVHYEGKLIDGTVFDSSYKRGETAEFPLLNVIPGWTEGICLMPIGSKYRFVIPYNLAYGDHGAGGVIPPYSTLIFEVELKGIKKYQEPKVETKDTKEQPAKKEIKKSNKKKLHNLIN